MDALRDFLRFSSPLDWLVILLAAVLILAGILLLILARSRKPIYFFLAAALLPLLLGIVTTYLKNRAVDRALAGLQSETAESSPTPRRLAPPPPPPPRGGRLLPTPTPLPTPDLSLVMEAGKREAMMSTYVGAAGTALSMVIGLVGLAMKKKTTEN